MAGLGALAGRISGRLCGNVTPPKYGESSPLALNEHGCGDAEAVGGEIKKIRLIKAITISGLSHFHQNRHARGKKNGSPSGSEEKEDEGRDKE